MRKQLLPLAMLAGLSAAAGSSAVQIMPLYNHHDVIGPAGPYKPKHGKDKNSGTNRVSQKKRRATARKK